jgi:vacuole morphology and inheritance protein 14
MFIQTNNNDPSLKKGGLRGLTAVTIGISINENLAANLFPLIIDPVLKCLKDQNNKIRFAACDTLYNIIKTLRDVVLIKFNDIFEELIDVVADVDDDVKKAA